jgi:hypothetical protein
MHVIALASYSLWLQNGNLDAFVLEISFALGGVACLRHIVGMRGTLTRTGTGSSDAF